MKINKVSMNTGWKILWKAWDLATVNYKLSLLLSFIILLDISLDLIILFITNTTLNSFLGWSTFLSEDEIWLVEVIKVIITSLIMSLITIVYTICSFHWERGEPYSMKKILADLMDKKIMKPLLPLIAVSFLLYCGYRIDLVIKSPESISGSIFASMIYNSFFNLILSSIHFILIFIYPILYFNPEIGFKKSFIKSLQGILKNTLPFTFGLILFAIFGFICFIFLVIPYIFVTTPVSICFYYLWYRVIFEDLTFDEEACQDS